MRLLATEGRTSAWSRYCSCDVIWASFPFKKQLSWCLPCRDIWNFKTNFSDPLAFGVNFSFNWPRLALCPVIAHSWLPVVSCRNLAKNDSRYWKEALAKIKEPTRVPTKSGMILVVWDTTKRKEQSAYSSRIVINKFCMTMMSVWRAYNKKLHNQWSVTSIRGSR